MTERKVGGSSRELERRNWPPFPRASSEKFGPVTRPVWTKTCSVNGNGKSALRSPKKHSSDKKNLLDRLIFKLGWEWRGVLFHGEVQVTSEAFSFVSFNSFNSGSFNANLL